MNKKYLVLTLLSLMLSLHIFAGDPTEAPPKTKSEKVEGKGKKVINDSVVRTGDFSFGVLKNISKNGKPHYSLTSNTFEPKVRKFLKLDKGKNPGPAEYFDVVADPANSFIFVLKDADSHVQFLGEFELSQVPVPFPMRAEGNIASPSGAGGKGGKRTKIEPKSWAREIGAGLRIEKELAVYCIGEDQSKIPTFKALQNEKPFTAYWSLNGKLQAGKSTTFQPKISQLNKPDIYTIQASPTTSFSPHASAKLVVLKLNILDTQNLDSKKKPSLLGAKTTGEVAIRDAFQAEILPSSFQAAPTTKYQWSVDGVKLALPARAIKTYEYLVSRKIPKNKHTPQNLVATDMQAKDLSLFWVREPTKMKPKVEIEVTIVVDKTEFKCSKSVEVTLTASKDANNEILAQLNGQRAVTITDKDRHPDLFKVNRRHAQWHGLEESGSGETYTGKLFLDWHKVALKEALDWHKTFNFVMTPIAKHKPLPTYVTAKGSVKVKRTSNFDFTAHSRVYGYVRLGEFGGDLEKIGDDIISFHDYKHGQVSGLAGYGSMNSPAHSFGTKDYVFYEFHQALVDLEKGKADKSTISKTSIKKDDELVASKFSTFNLTFSLPVSSLNGLVVNNKKIDKSKLAIILTKSDNTKVNLTTKSMKTTDNKTFTFEITAPSTGMPKGSAKLNLSGTASYEGTTFTFKLK